MTSGFSTKSQVPETTDDERYPQSDGQPSPALCRRSPDVNLVGCAFPPGPTGETRYAQTSSRLGPLQSCNQALPKEKQGNGRQRKDDDPSGDSHWPLVLGSLSCLNPGSV